MCNVARVVIYLTSFFCLYKIGIYVVFVKAHRVYTYRQEGSFVARSPRSQTDQLDNIIQA